ncbi:hypothetical protein SNEBB_002354 [Seison nebaliae]|nr:hypothetical protein SNEBB_002354 [Seison nebaliae]
MARAKITRTCLIVFNSIFLIIGLTCLVVGIYVVIKNRKALTDFTDGDFTKIVENAAQNEKMAMAVVGIFMAIFGLGMCIPALLVICAASNESKTLMILYVTLCLVYLIGSVVMIGVLSHKLHRKASYLRSATDHMHQYNSLNETIRQDIDVLQEKFKCCGASGPQDYTDYSQDIPESCKTCDGKICKKTCYGAFYENQKLFVISIAIIVLAVVVEIIGVGLGIYCIKKFSKTEVASMNPNLLVPK